MKTNQNKHSLLRSDNQRSLLDTQLIQLSYIFKKKFNVKVIDNKITQYSNTDKPYQDRIKYKTLIEIRDNRIIFKNGKIPDICIIRGWFDKTTDTYYIDLKL